MGTIRVLHCPKTVGNNAPELARAERSVGLRSRCVALDPPRFRYACDEVLLPDANRHALREVRRWQLLWRAVRDFDVVHFNFGESIMPLWVPPQILAAKGVPRLAGLAYRWYARLLEQRDLPVLKRAGKGIVVTYQGDDVRRRAYCRAHFRISPAEQVAPDYYLPAFDAHKARRAAVFDRYADRIFALNPDLLHVLPARARFLPYTSVDPRRWQPPLRRGPAAERPVVVHAPTHRGVKGTRYVVEAVSRLRDEGVPLEFVLAEGLSHGEVRRLYERADLLVDQVLCGWYGGVAVEGMALGKPVVCYIREADLAFLPDGMRADLPVIRAEPATLYGVLKSWLTDRKAELPERGRRCRAYVERWHDPVRVAEFLKGEYEAIVASSRRR